MSEPTNQNEWLDRFDKPTRKKLDRLLVRARALREVTDLISLVAHSNTISFEHRGNSYTEDEEKQKIDREIDKIRWQLVGRLDRVNTEIGRIAIEAIRT